MPTSQAAGDVSRPVAWTGPDGPLGLTGRERHRLAAVLVNAVRDGQRVTPFAQRYPELTVADAYRISRIVLQRRLDRGERIAALTTDTTAAGDPATRDVRRFGWVTDAMVRDEPCVVSPVPAADVIPCVALELRSTPPAGGGETGLLRALGAVYPCLEVVESRYRGGALTAADEIADNCGSALLVVGRRAPVASDLRAVRSRVSAGGRPAGSGQYDVLTEAVAMVAQLHRIGVALATGLLLAVPTGAMCVRSAPGVPVHAVFDGIGSVAVHASAS